MCCIFSSALTVPPLGHWAAYAMALCIICFSEMTDSCKGTVALGCGHSFHASCIVAPTLCVFVSKHLNIFICFICLLYCD